MPNRISAFNGESAAAMICLLLHRLQNPRPQPLHVHTTVQKCAIRLLAVTSWLVR
jgi:hypothetical protein